MKKYLYFLPVLFLLCSCGKSRRDPFGITTATVNGQVWEGNPTGLVSKKDANTYFDISIRKKGQKYPDLLTFSNIEKKTGKQHIYNGKDVFNNAIPTLYSVYFTSEDYDLAGDEYNILTLDSANNWIEITGQEDNFTRQIKGSFNLTLVRTTAYIGSPNPDTLRIRDGRFYISRLYDY